MRASFAKGRLYYFGARWYDPELGLWISPDPMHEFNSPYARGGDPVNFVDPDGNCELVCISIIVGAAVGAYFSGSSANQSYNPTEWNYKETWDEIAVGAAIGGAAGGVGAYVGGPAFIAGNPTGMLGWGATAGMVASSTTASVLSNIDDLARGRDPRGLSTNFGAFSVNWGAKDAFKWNNPLDDDPWYVNAGEAMGWVANGYDASNLAFPDRDFLGNRIPRGSKKDWERSLDDYLQQLENRKEGRDAWFWSNKIGPYNNMGAPRHEVDLWALRHDDLYSKLGAHGTIDAGLNVDVIGGDALLTGRSFWTAIRPFGTDFQTGNPMAWHTSVAAIGTGVVFGGITGAKTFSYLNMIGVSNNWREY